ncbi:MAG: GH3 auxin-responsive promoter family protein [Planctomycetaceae bacterium]|nr:GH3 auxin-responsive promoter family protein [Planctomycetaceae bacterium]
MLNSLVSLVGRFLARKVAKERLAFHHATMQPREVQHQLLSRLLRQHGDSAFGQDHGFRELHTLADFQRRMPISEYDDYLPYIERVKRGEVSAMFRDEQVVMFSLTSGTTSTRKFIPVTKQYLDDYRRGWSMWGLQVFEKYPHLFLQAKVGFGGVVSEFKTEAGIPCGSLSGLTASMNPGIVQRSYCLPANAANWADAQTRGYLNWRVALHRNLGMCVAPNPGILLHFARFGTEHAEQLIREVRNGGYSSDLKFPYSLRSWLKRNLPADPKRAAELEKIVERTCRLDPKDIWPGMGLIACWLGGPARAYLDQITDLFGDVPRRDIGLIASETRMSIPKEDGTPGGILDVTSAFFEFIPVAEMDSPSPTILEAADLETGKEYYILLTTTSGLYRYNIHDVVRVIDWHEKTPIVEFLHKGSRVSDVFGEKLTENQVVSAVREAAIATGIPLGDFSLVPPRAHEQTAYRLLIESSNTLSVEQRADLAIAIDRAMGEQNYLYKRKRHETLFEPLHLDVLPSGTWRAWDLLQLARSGGTLEQYKHPFLITDHARLDDLARIVEETDAVFSEKLVSSQSDVL